MPVSVQFPVELTLHRCSYVGGIVSAYTAVMGIHSNACTHALLLQLLPVCRFHWSFPGTYMLATS